MIMQEELRALVDLQLQIHDALTAWKAKRAEFNQRIGAGEDVEKGPIVPAMVKVGE